MESWKQGLKAVAVYRDGCKRTQPLSTSKTDPGLVKGGGAGGRRGEAGQERAAGGGAARSCPTSGSRSRTSSPIAGHEGYIHVGLYETGEPGEIFVKMAKEGSTISGLMDSFATAISLALQHGVPLRLLCDKFARTRFEPYGFTENPEIPRASSIMDYLFRWLAVEVRQRETPVAEAAPAPAASDGNPARRRGGRGRAEGRGRRRERASNGNGHRTATPTATAAPHRQRQLQLHRPHRRADLPRMRIDHDPQRQLPQVRQLRHDLRLLLSRA